MLAALNDWMNEWMGVCTVFTAAYHCNIIVKGYDMMICTEITLYFKLKNKTITLYY